DAELALGKGPIPAGPYYRHDYFELEREALFKRSWLHVGHMAEIAEPGSFIVRPVDIAGVSLLITHGKDGKIRAFHNVCTHRGTQLVSEQSGKAARFSCPYHFWTFSNDGQLQSAPDFDKFYVDKSACALKQVAVEVCARLIFINLEPTPRQTLNEFLGPIAGELETLTVARATHFSEYTYEINANWKLTYDNFQENYHLRFIHPKSGAAASGAENPFGYPLRYSLNDPHRKQTIWYNSNFKPTPIQGFALSNAVRYSAAEGFTNSEQAREYYAIFPNLFMLGSPTQPFSHTVIPIAHNRSRGVIRIYWIGEDDSASRRFTREYLMATALDLHAEDRNVIEAGQRGLDSGALD
ncbi:MAG: aromatic ring-hydroxylating oxygenase subunit alpha, partial [Halioglobus sp.]